MTLLVCVGTRYTSQIDPSNGALTSYIRWDAPTKDVEVMYPYSEWKNGVPPDTYWYDDRTPE